MNRPRCDSCAGFSALTNECRRKAPRAVPMQVGGDLQVRGVWPGTRADQWCVEWVPMTFLPPAAALPPDKSLDSVGSSHVVVAPVSP